MANARGAEGFIAVIAETRKKFWLDRSRTAAISKHTNAFKVNEDVVIPLPRMGDYCDGIERINIELSTQNKLALCDALSEFLQGELPLHAGDANLDKDVLIGDRRQAALEYVAAIRRRWAWLLDNLDLPLAEAEARFAEFGMPGRRNEQQGRRAQAFPPPAGLLGAHFVEAGTATAPRQDFRRQRLSSGPRTHRRHPQGSAARPGLRGTAHACRRRQRAYQHPGQFRQLRDAADRQPRGRTHHASGALARWRDFRRARHRHHQAGIPDRRGNRPLPRLQAEGRSRGPLQQGQADAGRRPGQRLYAIVQPARHRIADHGAVRDRQDFRHGQGLPALRQVQAGLLDACAARQPALLAAQQDPRHLAADRSLPLRRADPARHFAEAFRRIQRCRRPLHGLPHAA